MAHQWQGVIPEYRDRLPFTESDPVVTLGEGGTPLVHAKALDARTGATVYVKVEGMNPTGSFKDRGMTTAISQVLQSDTKVVACASTGNTSASASAGPSRPCRGHAASPSGRWPRCLPGHSWRRACPAA